MTHRHFGIPHMTARHSAGAMPNDARHHAPPEAGRNHSSRGLKTVEKLREFEGRTIAEAAKALGRCTEHVSRLCKKYGINLLINETDNLPRKRLASGRLHLCIESLTPEMLREWLDYNPETGVFVWKRAWRRNSLVGQSAGCLKPDGYICIGFFGVNFTAHRLAWFYIHGEWPRNFIDHIDGDTSNNAIANLREATPTQNVQNRICNGYRADRNGNFSTTIRINGERKYLGSFPSSDAARKAYLTATETYFGDFSVVKSRKDIGHA